MKPQRLKIESIATQSFSARCDSLPDINNNWHYHSESELIYFKKGRGTQFIGDSVKRFEDGDIVLLDGNLPHFWQYDPAYFIDKSANPIEVYVIHFSKNHLLDVLLNIPECSEISKAIERSKRGLSIKGETCERVGTIIQSITTANGFKRLILLLDALYETAICSDIEYLASFGFKVPLNNDAYHRLQLVYNYTITNYKKKISISEIADIAKVSPNSFCRFFKSQTGKHYSYFTNEVRIGHARKFLLDNKLNIKSICHECGFKNPVSFYKTFKIVTGFTPLVYQKMHHQ
ncbi:MAG: AraC family transcriptional regulator [Bacteroidota bacterium]